MSRVRVPPGVVFGTACSQFPDHLLGGHQGEYRRLESNWLNARGRFGQNSTPISGFSRKANANDRPINHNIQYVAPQNHESRSG